MSRENRASPRYELRVSAELRLEGGVVLGTTRNLSAGGVLIAVDRSIPEGTTLGLRLFVVEDDIESAEGAGLDLSGRIQWLAEGEERGFLVGVQFTNMSDRQTRALARALATLGG